MSHEAWMLRMLFRTSRLTAIMRMYSNGEKRVATPCRSNSVPDERKIQGMKPESRNVLGTAGLQVADAQQVVHTLTGCFYMGRTSSSPRSAG